MHLSICATTSYIALLCSDQIGVGLDNFGSEKIKKPGFLIFSDPNLYNANLSKIEYTDLLDQNHNCDFDLGHFSLR